MARVLRFHEYGEASVLKIENLDVPPAGAGEVQIDVKSIGFNRAVYSTPVSLQREYGSHPVGSVMFLRIRPFGKQR